MIKGLFSILRRSFLPLVEKEEPLNEEFIARSVGIDKKLSLLSESERKEFGSHLRGVLEHTWDSALYEARDPTNLPPSDILIVKENVYRALYLQISPGR